MYKRLLVPLDGSALAEKALPYAVELAAKLGAEVVLVNVRMPSEDPEKPEQKGYISKIAADVEQNIKKNPGWKTGEKVKVSSAIIGSTGIFVHAGEQIVDYAEKENISLIIIASHGRSGLRRFTLGSTADKVAGSAKCPVLLVRAGSAIGSVNLAGLLVTLDGSKESEAVLEHVVWLAPRLKTKVSLLNVAETLYHYYPTTQTMGYFGGGGMIKTPYSEEEMKPTVTIGEEYLKKVNDTLVSRGVTADYRVRTGTAAEAIIAAEKETGADIVVMSTYGHSGFGRWDHGSVADKVIHGGEVPLLLIRPK
ncbi:MAG: universal stress protein [Dehalococcoidales bacterium]|jgi:nucleotide-binding universal stress UspA family protein